MILCEISQIFNNIFLENTTGGCLWEMVYKTEVLGYIQSCWSFFNKTTSSQEQSQKYGEKMHWIQIIRVCIKAQLKMFL